MTDAPRFSGKKFGDAGPVKSLVLEAARQYVAAGLSVAPIPLNGEKHPAIEWATYQKRLPVNSELLIWFLSGQNGLCIIGGAVSGNLVIFDFESEAVFSEWAALVTDEAPAVLNGLPLAKTPGGGRHLYCRLMKPPEGNKKLAASPDPVRPTDEAGGKRYTLIETRGEGGLVLAPGSPPAVHESNLPYEWVNKGWIGKGDSAAISDETYDLFISRAHALDRCPENSTNGDSPPNTDASAPPPRADGKEKPGEHFSRAGPSWADILEPHGWTKTKTSRGVTMWRRPGKSKGGASATTGYCKAKNGNELFKVFSSNADPFKVGGAYSKFSVYTFLNHNGDFAGAARQLGKDGYGEQPRTGKFSRVNPEDGTEFGPDGEKERPEIIITTDEPHVVKQVIAALAEDPDLYHRGGSLVHVIEEEHDSRRLHESGSPKIREMPNSIIRSHIVDHCSLVKIGKKGDTFTCHPPDWITSQVADRGEWRGLRELKAVSESPVLRPDGSVLQTAGYDADTKILYLPNASYLPIDTAPTIDDAVQGIAQLLDVVCDVPFETPTHAASWLAALLTPLARHAFAGPAPLFLTDANVRAAGKGLTLSVVTLIATGRRFAVSGYAHDPAEMEKIITSIAMAGEPMVLLDNVTGPFGNGPLDRALTATEWRGRILGGNNMPTFPLYSIWYATGNNVSLEGDAARRICHVRIESHESNPENRQGFKRPDLLRWVKSERARLLKAALTILAAYCTAGRPNQNLTPWGSFDGWSDLVRSAIVWAGQPDPGDVRAQLSSTADTANNTLAVLLRIWVQICPVGSSLTAAAWLSRVEDGVKNGHQGSIEIADALKTILPGKQSNQMPTSRQLGTVLRGFRGRRGTTGEWFDGDKKDRNGVAVWSVIRPESNQEDTPHTPQDESMSF